MKSKNQQIRRIRVSTVFGVFICGIVICSFGCDLGTYSKRFKERNQPVKAAEPEKQQADEKADSTDSE
jgi:hypothetical protein